MPASNPSSPVAQLLAHLKGDPLLREGHKEIFLARAPGRLDVMGGITDYSGGLVCQYPLAASAAVALQRRDDRKLIIKNFNPDAPGTPAHDQTVTLSLDDFYGSASLLPHEAMQNLFTGPRAWAAGIAGAFPILARHKKITRSTHGATIACCSNIPAGAGSTAALACANLWAMTAAYHLILDPMEIAVLAQRIENQVAAVPAGVAPHAASVLGRMDQLMLLQCQPHEINGYLALPKGLAIVGLQLGAPGDGSAYCDARIGAFMAQAIIARMYADLGVKKDPTKGYLANVSADAHRRYFSQILPEHLTGADFLANVGPIADRLTAIDPQRIYAPRAAAEHHILEAARTRTFVEHLRHAENAPDSTALHNRAAAAGRCMFDSYTSAARLGLATANADRLVTLVTDASAAGLFGVRLSGSSGAIAVVLLEETPQAREALDRVIRDFAPAKESTPVLLTGSSPGACEAAPQRVPLTELLG